MVVGWGEVETEMSRLNLGHGNCVLNIGMCCLYVRDDFGMN